MNILSIFHNKIRIECVKILKKLNSDEGVFYISSGTYLPAPLTAEEEKICILGISEATNKQLLIEHNLRLVVYIAKKFDNTNICVDDLISIGTIGLIKAINTFNVDKQIKLATYASRCIENEILMYLRKNSIQKTVISFDEPLHVDWDGNELLLSDVLGTDEDSVDRHIEEEVEKELLFDAINMLNPREKEIMQLRYGLFGVKEKTQKEVADLLGISQSYISRLEKRIITRLKSEISKNI